MKKITKYSIVIVSLLGLMMIASSAGAEAGRYGHHHQRHHYDSVSGSPSHPIDKRPSDRCRYRPPVARVPFHRCQPSPPPPAGYWELRRVWVPATYRQVWNPAHYNERGHWVSGRYIEIVDQPGHWEKQRIWVCNDRRMKRSL